MTHWLIQLAPLQHFIEKRQHLFHEKNKYKFCFSKVKHQSCVLGSCQINLIRRLRQWNPKFCSPSFALIDFFQSQKNYSKLVWTLPGLGKEASDEKQFWPKNWKILTRFYHRKLSIKLYLVVVVFTFSFLIYSASN